MDVTAISDLHGNYPELPGGDLLIVAGDLTARDTEEEYDQFYNWLPILCYSETVIVAGNHDGYLQKNPGFFDDLKEYCTYLCDSELTLDRTSMGGSRLKIYGSPWTLAFPGMNPHCKAFTVDTEEELAEKWKLIPNDVDILVTHSPPYGILDRIDFSEGDSSAIHVGSKTLASYAARMKLPPKLWVWGHIHESYGRDMAIRGANCIMVNASHVNERYEPVNKPIRIEL